MLRTVNACSGAVFTSKPPEQLAGRSGGVSGTAGGNVEFGPAQPAGHISTRPLDELLVVELELPVPPPAPSCEPPP
jgi:hypothetical protein